MSFSFNASLSGLNANSNALGVVGNNIANANTIGFRSSNVTFMDVFASSVGARLNGAGNSMQIGDGVRVGAIHTNFSQANFNEGGSPLQAAIQGNGFFVVRNADGTQAYTRAGDFTVNRQGLLVASNGANVMGYMAQNGTVPQGASLSQIQIPIGQTLAPHASSEGTFRMNLNSASETGSTFHSTMQVYDSLGTSRTLDVTYTRPGKGTFETPAAPDGHAAQVNGGASANFAFDSNGNLTAPTSMSITPDQSQLG